MSESPRPDTDSPPQQVTAPHAAAEADPRDPSRAANQAREEPVLSTPAHDLTPGTRTGQPDAPAGADDAVGSPGSRDRAGGAAGGADRPGGAAGDRDQAGRPAAGGDQAGVPAGGDQAGVPARAVTDVTAAPGTSESLLPVEGVHTPDAGPDGADFDTDEPGLPGRTTDAR